MSVISNGNYKQRFNYTNKKGDKKSTHLEIPFTKWSLDKTSIIMPKLSILQTVKHNKKMWGIVPNLVYSGKNKSIAFCNHVTVIKDLKFLERCLHLDNKSFDYKTLKENEKETGTKLGLILKETFNLDLEYNPEFAKQIQEYLFPEPIEEELIQTVNLN